MAERTIETKMKLTGEEEYVAGIERITKALKAASEAKREFDDLFRRPLSSASVEVCIPRNLDLGPLAPGAPRCGGDD